VQKNRPVKEEPVCQRKSPSSHTASSFWASISTQQSVNCNYISQTIHETEYKLHRKNFIQHNDGKVLGVMVKMQIQSTTDWTFYWSIWNKHHTVQISESRNKEYK